MPPLTLPPPLPPGQPLTPEELTEVVEAVEARFIEPGMKLKLREKVGTADGS